MNQRVFWIVFAVVQSIGATLALLLPNARPVHFLAVAFPFTVVCLSPGLLVSSWLLDALRLPSRDGEIVSVAVVLNAIFWFGVVATIIKIRRRSASREHN